MNIDRCKSYLTRNRLEGVLLSCGLRELKYVVVRNSEGRWTAIFPRSFLPENYDAFYIANRGFMVLG